MKQKGFWQIFLLVTVLLCGTILLASCGTSGDGEETTTAYCTVTFQTNGGSLVDSKQIAEGGLVSRPPDPTKEGYLFGGWIKESGYEWGFDYETVKSDLTLEAKWIAIESVFSYRKLEGTDTVLITELKNKELGRINIPTIMAGWTVVGIDQEVFLNLSDEYVTEITIPKTVTIVGEGAFQNCDGISIVLEEGCALTEIGEKAFQNCNGLKKITLGEGLKTISFESFLGCTGLTELRLPKSVELIEENAFAKCSALKTVMLYSDITAIQNMAFDECDALRTVFFFGSEAEADVLLDQKADATNEALLEAAVYLYAEVKPSESSDYGYWYWSSNGTAKVWQ